MIISDNIPYGKSLLSKISTVTPAERDKLIVRAMQLGHERLISTGIAVSDNDLFCTHMTSLAEVLLLEAMHVNAAMKAILDHFMDFSENYSSTSDFRKSAFKLNNVRFFARTRDLNNRSIDTRVRVFVKFEYDAKEYQFITITELSALSMRKLNELHANSTPTYIGSEEVLEIPLYHYTIGRIVQDCKIICSTNVTYLLGIDMTEDQAVVITPSDNLAYANKEFDTIIEREIQDWYSELNKYQEVKFTEYLNILNGEYTDLYASCRSDLQKCVESSLFTFQMHGISMAYVINALVYGMTMERFKALAYSYKTHPVPTFIGALENIS